MPVNGVGGGNSIAERLYFGLVLCFHVPLHSVNKLHGNAPITGSTERGGGENKSPPCRERQLQHSSLLAASQSGYGYLTAEPSFRWISVPGRCYFPIDVLAAVRGCVWWQLAMYKVCTSYGERRGGGCLRVVGPIHVPERRLERRRGRVGQQLTAHCQFHAVIKLAGDTESSG